LLIPQLFLVAIAIFLSLFLPSWCLKSACATISLQEHFACELSPLSCLQYVCPDFLICYAYNIIVSLSIYHQPIKNCSRWLGNYFSWYHFWVRYFIMWPHLKSIKDHVLLVCINVSSSSWETTVLLWLLRS